MLAKGGPVCVLADSFVSFSEDGGLPLCLLVARAGSAMASLSSSSVLGCLSDFGVTRAFQRQHYRLLRRWRFALIIRLSARS